MEDIVEQLMGLEADLIRSGLGDEAGSLRTVIADLGWQLEEANDAGGVGDE